MSALILSHHCCAKRRLSCFLTSAAIGILMLSGFSPLRAGDTINFKKQVWPILQASCFGCHGADDQQGQLRLDAQAIALHGGIGGPAIVPGKPDESLLIQRIRSDDDEKRMPLEDDPLSDDDVAVLVKWIEQGARWPDGIGSAAKPSPKHWSYTSPERPAIPSVEDTRWVSNAIDLFVLSQLESHQIAPSPEVQKRRLIRRLSLDLLGIPPSVDEVERFALDERPDAYARLVERYLASPLYGERWARPWLDLARYADSNGYQADQYREVWPFRDWVIDALNRDMPYDQFTVEQIAGDLLPNATLAQKIATGFHRLTTCNVEAGVDPEANRVEQVVDRVNTTGMVWLGTTFECMQCHNHKYDPFTQKEYYQVFAYFNQTPLEVEGNGVSYNFVGPKMDLPLTAKQQVQRNVVNERLEKANAKLNEARETILAGLPQWETDLLESLVDEPKWHLLQIDAFRSKNGAGHRMLEDGSVLITGERPDIDTYELQISTTADAITGFKLETLTHDELPGKGPGRFEAVRPNFVLNEFVLTDIGGNSILLEDAIADYSQPNFDVKNAIDGDLKTAWAIAAEFHKPHAAEFLTSEAIRSDGKKQLKLRLEMNYGGGRTIGRIRLSAMTGTRSMQGVSDAIVAIVKTPVAERKPAQTKQLTDYYLKQSEEVTKLQKQVDAVKKELADVKPTTTLVMVEDQSRETHVLKRGDFKSPGGSVLMGTPRVLNGLPEEAPQNRLGLASWIVDRSNPLTARVAVNRWWAELFGRGIVATEEDFGTQGDRPTHPKLLDYLAVEFMESGWSMKHIHRLIVHSSTYRQSSKSRDDLKDIDPNNLLLARGPRFRLDAEQIRDNALQISGLLQHKIGGPPVYPPQPNGLWRHVGRNAPKYATSTGTDRYRRGIYTVWRRSAPYASFTNFDAPDRAACVVRRARTNTPLQALTLLNDVAFLEMARAFGERIHVLPSGSRDEKIVFAFQTAVSRYPTAREMEILQEVFESELTKFKEDAGRAKKIVDESQQSLKDVSELATWIQIGHILLNLDETISKG